MLAIPPHNREKWFTYGIGKVLTQSWAPIFFFFALHCRRYPKRSKAQRKLIFHISEYLGRCIQCKQLIIKDTRKNETILTKNSWFMTGQLFESQRQTFPGIDQYPSFSHSFNGFRRPSIVFFDPLAHHLRHSYHEPPSTRAISVQSCTCKSVGYER